MGEVEVASSSSRSGHPVLKVNGRWLASPFDPLKEAEQWIQRLPFDPKRFEAIAVLGASCGYHLEALSRHNGNLEIYVFEAESAVMRWTRERLNGSTVIHWIAPEDMESANTPRVERLLSRIYGVAIHPSITSDHGEFYSRVLKLLLARDEEGWADWQKASAQEHPLQLKPARENSTAALSIKDLIAAPGNPFTVHDRELQLYALQELIL